MRKFVIIVFLILITIPFGLRAEAAEIDFRHPPKNILVLFSYAPYYPSSDMLLHGLYDAFSGENVHFQVEYMDTKLMQTAESDARLLAMLKDKIALLQHIDLIVTFDDNALQYIDTYYESLFGEDAAGTIPIVFTGCNDYETTEAIYASRTNIAGELEPSARIDTINVAVKLIPDYESITVLVDNTITGMALRNRLIADNHNDYPLSFIISNDQTYDELAHTLEKLTPKDIFLFISCFEDSAGSRMTYIQASNFLYDIVNTPIFCTTSYNVGTLFAGGFVQDKSLVGYSVGVIGKGILFDGKTAADFGLNTDVDANMVYLFNTDILSRYNIPISALPENAHLMRGDVEVERGRRSSLDRSLIALSIFLGICIFVVATFAFSRHSKALQQEHIALTDPLTGAGSRMALNTKLSLLIGYCSDENLKATLLFFDVDGFKRINDEYGHTAGDETLKKVIQRIQSVLSKNSDIYRYGGDEFIILMRNPTDKVIPEIDGIAEQFRRPFAIGHASVPINLSIGAVEIPRDGQDADTLIKNADKAMYAAKTFNTTRVIYFSHLPKKTK